MRLIVRLHPLAGTEQSGIVIQPPSLVEYRSRAISNVLAVPVRIVYAGPPSEYTVRVV